MGGVSQAFIVVLGLSGVCGMVDREMLVVRSATSTDLPPEGLVQNDLRPSGPSPFPFPLPSSIRHFLQHRRFWRGEFLLRFFAPRKIILKPTSCFWECACRGAGTGQVGLGAFVWTRWGATSDLLRTCPLMKMTRHPLLIHQ